MSTIKINELADGSLALNTLTVFADQNGLAFKRNLSDFKDFLSTLDDTAFKGSISAGTYASKDAGWYIADGVGDYIMGSTTLTVASQNLGIIIVPAVINDSNLVSIPISIAIDNALDSNSTNAVENGVVTDALDLKADKTNVLEKDNTTAYTPTADYHPVTKKYLEENTSNVSGGESIFASTATGSKVGNISAFIKDLKIVSGLDENTRYNLLEISTISGGYKFIIIDEDVNIAFQISHTYTAPTTSPSQLNDIVELTANGATLRFTFDWTKYTTVGFPETTFPAYELDNSVIFGDKISDVKALADNNTNRLDILDIDDVDGLREELDAIPKETTAEVRSNLYDVTANLFDKTYYVEGYYGNSGNTFQADNTLWTSDFIPVVEGETYKKTNILDGYYVYAYDVNKEPIIVNNGQVFWQQFNTDFGTIPVGVAYVKIIFDKATLDTAMFTLDAVDTSTYIPHLEIKEEFAGSPSYTIKNYNSNNYLGVVDNQGYNTDYSHFVWYGQSLSMGWETSEKLTLTPVDGVFMIGDKVWINKGNDGTSVLTPLVATDGDIGKESPAISAVNGFKIIFDKMHPKAGNVDFIATNTGDGGRSIERLSKESTNGENFYTTTFLTAINRAKSIADTNSKTISCPAIVWMQGEHNYTSLTGAGLTSGTDATTDKDTYKALLLTLKNNMQADVMSIYGQTKPPLFYMYQIGGGYINNETMSINQAFIEFEAENEDVVLMNPHYALPDYNNGHLSSNGARWYGEYINKAFFKTTLENKKSVTVKARDIEVLSGDDKILIHCEVPSPPLVIDTKTLAAVTNNGFIIKDDTGDITPDSIEIVNGSSILITLPRAITTNAFVSYAGYLRNGEGNIRDSENWNPLYDYADESTGFVAPRYTPLDADGNNLYSEKYPMFNWLSHFYKELN